MTITSKAAAKPSPSAAAVELVLGDRQRHELRLTPTPTPAGEAFQPAQKLPTLRIYVATRLGEAALIDDRPQLGNGDGERVEVIQAEYAGTATETPLAVGHGPNPRLMCRSECKGDMLYQLGQDNQRRQPMDYVAFLDDDIEVSVSDLLRATELAARKGCAIFQLQLSSDSPAVWPQLKQRQGPGAPTGAGHPELWDQINFVEVMAPVIAQRELDAGLLNVLAPFKSGFGWDFYLLPVLQLLYPDFQPGLFRGACMRHLRAVRTEGNSRFSHGLTASQEEELLRAGILLCLLEQPLPMDRGVFLGRLANRLERLGPVEQALASALASHTDRQWRCRSLEAQHNALQQQLEQRRAAHEAELMVLEQRLNALETSASWKLGQMLLAPIKLLKKLTLGQGS
jgi:hypothetical protein